jgi:hypothetical protein
MKSIPSLLTILIASFAAIIQVTTNTEFAGPSVKHWLTDSNRNRNDLLKTWFDNKRAGGSADSRSASSLFDLLHKNHQFKGACDSHYFPLRIIFK